MQNGSYKTAANRQRTVGFRPDPAERVSPELSRRPPVIEGRQSRKAVSRSQQAEHSLAKGSRLRWRSGAAKPKPGSWRSVRDTHDELAEVTGRRQGFVGGFGLFEAE